MPDTLPSIPIDYGIALDMDDGVEQQRFGDNYSQAVQKGIQRNRQVWSVGWSQIKKADFLTLRNFFRDLGTAYFEWTPPSETTPLKWRLQRGSFKGGVAGFNNYTVSVVLEQAFDTA
jgi:phage-related protein